MIQGGVNVKQRRRGAAIPAANLVSPVRLSERAQKVWDAALRSRPDFFTESDAYDLAQWCVHTAELDAYLNGETRCTMRELADLTKIRLQLGRSLRLTADARAENDAAVPAPATPTSRDGDEGGSRSPWRVVSAA